MRKRDAWGTTLIVVGIVILILKNLVGVALVLVGIAGIFLPIIPGIILVLLGIYLLSPTLFGKIKLWKEKTWKKLRNKWKN